MRKQTKLVAVLSAAALLAVGASMTSFAAGWTEENGTWVYYDNDDELVTNEWKKSGSNYYYLNDDGEMATETWVDDEYYVDETGKMVTNAWLKLVDENADYDDPNEDGEAWYYFDSKGSRVEDTKKTINGKVYYFDSDGRMEDGWYEEDNNIYYLGDEDDGARKSGWVWLEKPDEDEDDVDVCGDDDCVDCEEEGWYWFAKDGKMYNKGGQKKIDGRYYYFNEHGQMLYNWIVSTDDDVPNKKDDEDMDDSDMATDIRDMRYAFNVDKGWRVNGWLQVDGSYSLDRQDDEDWYFFDDGEAENAISEKGKDVTPLLNKDGEYGLEDARILAKIKVEGKWFCFDKDGRMKTGLQAIADDKNGYDVYYFDENGFMKTGKVTNVEEDDGDVETYYFETSNAKKGRGVTGEEGGYLYYKGKRLEAEDDYKLYQVEEEIYLVNSSGKIQKGTSGKKINDGKIEDFDYDGLVDEDGDDTDTVYVYTNKDGEVQKITAIKDDKAADIIDRAEIAVAPQDIDFGWED